MKNTRLLHFCIGLLFFSVCFQVSAQQNFTFNYDGLIRDYTLYTPDNLPDNPPLVFVLHGYWGNAGGVMNYSGMNEVADQNKFDLDSLRTYSCGHSNGTNENEVWYYKIDNWGAWLAGY